MLKQLSDIKKQVDKLKQSTPITSNSIQRITESVDQLTHSVNSMIGLFKEAGEEIRFEEKEKDIVEERLIPLEVKVDKLIEQNKQIAEGIVVLADMLKSREQAHLIKPAKPIVSLPPINLPERMFSMPSKLPLMKPKNLQPMPSPFPSQGPRRLPPMPPLPRFEEFRGGKELPPLPPPPFPIEEPKKKKFGLF